jgi:calcineurin-like phosphoesterase family protein
MVKEKNQAFVDLWNSFEGDKYHVLGNHDMDNESKTNYIKFVGASDRYYSFDKGDYHFIVMDPNNLKEGDKYTPYAHANFYVDAAKRAWVDTEQVAWLKEDLKKTNKRCIIFTHQSLEQTVGNREEIRAIFEAENEQVGYTKVVAALSGHDHTDYQKEINGIAYIQINSASNQWVGSDYQCDTRYTPEINKAHPSLKYVVPYEEALYAMVTLKKHSLKIKGKKSKFVSPTPQDLKIPKELHSCPLVPQISDYKIKFK